MKIIVVVVALAAPSVAFCQAWSVESCSAALEHAYSTYSARDHATTAGDFNSDGEGDVALLLDSRHDSHKSAIGVCLSREPRPLLITAPYESAKILAKPKGTAYVDFETGEKSVYERDAISVSDGARAGASYVLRGGVFARVIDGN